MWKSLWKNITIQKKKEKKKVATASKRLLITPIEWKGESHSLKTLYSGPLILEQVNKSFMYYQYQE